ncbi:MAG: hypothetical protein EBU66_10330 [Bacteroidetes bacterium]|nr:hypothetical protein [Bacteroidota bacterium]
MNDNSDNVTYLNFNTKHIDKDSLSYFLEGATEYAAYQDAESFAGACLRGILMAAEKKVGLKNEKFHSDAAVIAVMITGLYMRQTGVECPETHLLDDVREALTVIKKGEEE